MHDWKQIGQIWWCHYCGSIKDKNTIFSPNNEILLPTDKITLCHHGCKLYKCIKCIHPSAVKIHKCFKQTGDYHEHS